MIRYFYSAFLYILTPFILLRLAWRARQNPAYFQRLLERWGFYQQHVHSDVIWVHAVSVGEVLAAVPLIKALNNQYPQMPIIVTTTTVTGSDRVNTILADLVTHLYLPYDFPDAINRFLNTIKPRIAILMETELWPNLLHFCGKKNIPVILTNARLSTRSAQGYLRLANMTRAMMQHLTMVIAQTQDDADRFVTLGVNPTKIKIAGSIKFDLEIPADLEEKANTLRELWGKDRLVWIASSTHEGEEEIVLQAFAAVKKTLPQLLLVLVPRHPERFESVALLCGKQNYNVIMRTENKLCTNDTDVFIGDTMGELLLFYAASDVAYVGGSLVRKGGQNPLEPAALGLPILTGPYVYNFALINQQLQEVQAAMQINNSEQLAKQVIELFQNDALRKQMGQQAKKFVEKNRGALARQLKLIKQYLG